MHHHSTSLQDRSPEPDGPGETPDDSVQQSRRAPHSVIVLVVAVLVSFIATMAPAEAKSHVAEVNNLYGSIKLVDVTVRVRFADAKRGDETVRSIQIFTKTDDVYEDDCPSWIVRHVRIYKNKDHLVKKLGQREVCKNKNGNLSWTVVFTKPVNVGDIGIVEVKLFTRVKYWYEDVVVRYRVRIDKD